MKTRLLGVILLAALAAASLDVCSAQQTQIQNLPAGNFPPPPGADGTSGNGSASPGFRNPGPMPETNTSGEQPGRQNFADELTDFGVPPQPQMQPNVGTETPTSIPGGHVITTAEMSKAAGMGVVLVDVLERGLHPGIPGALLMPGAGSAGTFDDAVQNKLWTALKQATNMRPDRPIAFLCAGSRCWESYNAALRAEKMGFKMVLWYRGGLAAWQAAGLPMTQPAMGGRPPPPAQGSPGFDNPG